MSRIWVRCFLVCSLLSLLALSYGTAAQSSLTLLHCWDGPREALVHQMLADFEAEYGITVEPRLVGCGELTERFVLMHAGGVSPDVVMLNSVSTLSSGMDGAVLPLDSFMERDGLDDALWIPSEIEQARVFGVTYGLPIRTGAEDQNLFFLNVDHFDAVGVEAGPIQYWDDLFAIAQKLVRYEDDQLVRNPISRLNGPLGDSNDALQWLYANGGRLHSEDLKRIEFGSPEAIDAAQWVHDFLSRVYRSVNDHVAAARGRAGWLEGTTSIFVSGVYEIFYTQEQAPHMRFKFSPRPVRAAGSQYRTVNNGTFNYAISSQTRDPDAAWELLKWLTVRKESAGEFMLAQGRPSPILEYNYDPRYLEINSDFMLVVETMLRTEPRSLLPVINETATMFGAAFRNSIRGQAAPGPALTSAAEAAQARLDAYWASQKNTQ